MQLFLPFVKGEEQLHNLNTLYNLNIPNVFEKLEFEDAFVVLDEVAVCFLQGDTCWRNLYKAEICTDAHDQNRAVWLVSCVWKFLVQETCTG